jgi:hypothetical protein
MKKMAIYILSGLLTLVYMSGVVGVGVYNCPCSHSQQIVLFANDNCECNYHKTQQCAHPEDGCCDGSGGGDHCCDVEYKILDTDQEASSSTSILENFTQLISTLYFPVAVLEFLSPTMTASADRAPPPSGSLVSHNIYYFSQLRL